MFCFLDGFFFSLLFSSLCVQQQRLGRAAANEPAVETCAAAALSGIKMSQQTASLQMYDF